MGVWSRHSPRRLPIDLTSACKSLSLCHHHIHPLPKAFPLTVHLTEVRLDLAETGVHWLSPWARMTRVRTAWERCLNSLGTGARRRALCKRMRPISTSSSSRSHLTGTLAWAPRPWGWSQRRRACSRRRSRISTIWRRRFMTRLSAEKSISSRMTSSPSKSRLSQNLRSWSSRSYQAQDPIQLLTSKKKWRRHTRKSKKMSWICLLGLSPIRIPLSKFPTLRHSALSG